MLKNKAMTDKSKRILKYILSAIVVITVSGLIFVVSYNPEYSHFNKKRTAEMEKIFSISVTDDIELKYYQEINDWFTGDTSYTLYIDSVDSPEKFIQNNINGTITAKTENGVFYDYVKNTQKNVAVSEDYAVRYVYKFPYEVKDMTYYNEVWIDFIKKDNMYSAHLNMY